MGYLSFFFSFFHYLGGPRSARLQHRSPRRRWRRRRRGRGGGGGATGDARAGGGGGRRRIEGQGERQGERQGEQALMVSICTLPSSCTVVLAVGRLCRIIHGHRSGPMPVYASRYAALLTYHTRPSHLVATVAHARAQWRTPCGELDPRTPAATRDSDVLGSTAADLPLAT